MQHGWNGCDFHREIAGDKQDDRAAGSFFLPIPCVHLADQKPRIECTLQVNEALLLWPSRPKFARAYNRNSMLPKQMMPSASSPIIAHLQRLGDKKCSCPAPRAAMTLSEIAARKASFLALKSRHASRFDRFDSRRFPPFAGERRRTPKVGLSILLAGGAKFVWLSTLVNVDSKRTPTRSLTLKTLASPRLTASVPGPWRAPTAALPKRPAPAGVGENAAEAKYRGARLASIDVV